MVLPTTVSLLYAPANAVRPASAGVEVFAELGDVSDRVVRTHVMAAWWSDDGIDPLKAAREIDRHWDWRATVVEVDGRDVEARRLAVITGDGEVQGAMLLTASGIAMEGPAERGHTALMVEWLFAAPRNRPELVRRRSQPIYYGSGTHLLRAAVVLSREAGCAGRLKLDASPGALAWYERRGLPAVPGERKVHESVAYTPMELSSDAAELFVPIVGTKD